MPPLPLIHIDILTPKQVMLFKPLIEKLRAAGYRVAPTTRQYREVQQLLALKGVEAEVVGRHGGPTPKGKLEASLERTRGLAELFSRLEPALSVSFASPEAARASFGLKIPHICISDSPHAEAVSRLTIPLSERLLCSHVIPLKAWLRVGARAGMIVRYKGLDQAAWLRTYPLDRDILDGMGLSESRPIIAVRLEETYAAYLEGGKELWDYPTPKILNRTMELFGNSIQIIVLPRYEDHYTALKARIGRGIKVLRNLVDGPSLLARCAIFVGGGGTMTTEAALMGIPTVSCGTIPHNYVEKFLVRKGLVYKPPSPEGAVAKIGDILENLEAYQSRHKPKAEALLSGMENPLDRILKVVSSFCRSPA